MIKPGYRSSEFWLTIVSFVFSGLYLIGLLDDHSQKEDLIAETSRGVEAIILVIGQLTVLYRYVKGRSELKKVWWNTASPEERKEANTRNARTKKTKPKKPKVSTIKEKTNVNNNS
jgi:hypothetical protein